MEQARPSGVNKRLVLLAWALLLPVLAGYAVLRQTSGQLPFALSQVLFLLPVLLAAFTAYGAHFAGPPGFERRAWGLVSLTMFVLFVSEGYYSWVQWTVSVAGPPSPSAYDALNLLAAGIFLVTLGSVAGFGRMETADQLRFVCDGTAVAASLYVALYHFWVRPMAVGVSWLEPARWTAYSVVGVVILVGTIWIAGKASAGTERRIAAHVGVTLAIFAVGMIVWPIWRLNRAATSGNSADVVVGVVYLLGYYLLMLAALVRLEHRDASWRSTTTRTIGAEGIWTSTVLALFVLVSVTLMGAWAYLAPKGAPDIVLYVVGGLIATVGLVARTGVTSIETVVLRNTADIDSVTGAYNQRCFRSRADRAFAAAGRRGSPVSLIVVDVDGFSQVNASLGHVAGDGVLADIATTARSVLDPAAAELFRLSGDEFVILARVAEEDAVALASEVLSAIKELEPASGLTISASVGVAGCSASTCDRDELLRKANTAQAWAKYHGKGRVVRFDERIVRALGVEERLRLQPERSHLDTGRALAAAADARDPRNYYHSRNVAALAVILGEALGLQPDEIHRIEIAAMLHDCGKLCLPDELLPDVLLTSRQQLAVREHAEIGGCLVVSLGLPDVPAYVRHHHERWDGAGYPDGLGGEAVPLGSRIIALADAYDAMTSGTRHRVPLSRAAALQEIDLGMGSRFEPTLAELFIEVVGATTSLGWSDGWTVA